MGRGGIRLGSVVHPWRCATVILADGSTAKECAICARADVAANSKKQTEVSADQRALALTRILSAASNKWRRLSTSPDESQNLSGGTAALQWEDLAKIKMF
jgi:hypothetical protein